MLKCADIIERSISPWASPVVIVHKKSAPGEPPRRRMCVDYRRINKLQPEVTKADGAKRMHISHTPTKNRQTVRKIKRLQSVFWFGPKIRILSHWLVRFSKTKISICTIISWKIAVQQSSIWSSTSTSIFSKTDQRCIKRLQLCNGIFR